MPIFLRILTAALIITLMSCEKQAKVDPFATVPDSIRERPIRVGVFFHPRHYHTRPVTRNIVDFSSRYLPPDNLEEHVELEKMLHEIEKRANIRFLFPEGSVEWQEPDFYLGLVFGEKNMRDLIEDNDLLPLDEPLARFAPGAYKNRSPEYWKANLFGGRIMGIPIQYYPFTGYWIVRRDVREDLGRPPVENYVDLIAFAYEVKRSGTQDFVPLLTNSFPTYGDFRLYYEHDMRFTPAMPNCLLFFRENDGRVHNLFDEMSSAVESTLDHVRTLFADGILGQNTLRDFSQLEYEPRLDYSRRAAACFATLSQILRSQEQFVEAAEGTRGQVYEYFEERGPRQRPVMNLRSDNYLVVTGWGQQDITRVMEMINWFNDRDTYDLLNFGIRGTHWKPVGEESYDLLEKSYRKSNPLPLLSSNPAYERVPSVFGEDFPFHEQLAAFSRRSGDFEFDILHGFEFDSSAVRGDIQMLEALYYRKYYFPVFNGIEDRKRVWERVEESAGPILKKIQDELQWQIDIFLEAECPSCLDPSKPADLP